MTTRILIKLTLFTAFLFALGTYMGYQITGHIPIFNKDTVQSNLYLDMMPMEITTWETPRHQGLAILKS